MTKKNLTYQLSSDVLKQEIDGESVLLDMKSENYFGINDVGTKTLELLKDGATINDLMAKLMELYDVDKKQLEIDITSLLQQLLDAGLVACTHNNTQ